MFQLLIHKGELYLERINLGPYKVYLALESARSINKIVKVVDLTRDANVYLTSKTVRPFVGKLDEDLLEVARKYNYTND